MSHLYKRTATSLRHLCSLGLPGEVVVPQFLALLDEAIPSDSHHFNWFDRDMQLVNSYSNVAGVKKYTLLFAEFVASQPIRTPQWKEANQALRDGREHEINRCIVEFTHNEVMRPMGAYQSIGSFVFDPAKIQGVINLWRPKGNGYTEMEVSFVTSLRGYLSYALNAPVTDNAPALTDDGNQGVAIIARNGQLLQMDEVAERLLQLAAYPVFDATIAKSPNGLSAPLDDLCRNLVRMTEGKPATPPQLFHSNKWGRFVFRAHWLHAHADNAHGLIAVTIVHQVPRKVKLWRAIHTLGLPARQQEVCLLFAEGNSLPVIAKRLGVSQHTAIDHLRQIYSRMGLHQSDRSALCERLLELPPRAPVSLPAESS